jgi:hypothetical protein
MRHARLNRPLGRRVVMAAALAGPAAVAAASWNPFMISSPTGFPLGPAVRTPQHIATLIQALEPYVPSLHRNPANDRYRLALWLLPVDGRGSVRHVSIAEQRPAGEFRLAGLLGCDGRTVWFGFNGVAGVDLETGKLVGPAQLRAANRGLDESWSDPRRITFDGRLRVTSPDRKTVLEVDPTTLAVRPVVAVPRVSNLPLEPTVADFLSTGVRPAPAQWLGLHTAQEAARDYRPGGWLTRNDQPAETKAARRFYRGALDPAGAAGRPTVLSMAPQEGEEYLNAAFVRSGMRTDPLRLEKPDGYLMIYTAGPGLGATTIVARVGPDMRLAWKTDTGIDRFKLRQILPDARTPAFIGTRPAVPDKVPEPILVVVDAHSGRAVTTTLWR